MKSGPLIPSSLFPVLFLVLAGCPSVTGSQEEPIAPGTEAPPATVGEVVTTLDPRIWAMHQDQNGHLWFGSNGSGLYRYDGDTLVRYGIEDGLGSAQVRDIQGDPRGNLLVSTTGGVSLFDGKAFTPLAIEEDPAEDGWSLDPNDVWIVFDLGTHGPCRFDGEKLYEMPLSKSPVEDAWNARFPNSSFSPRDIYSIHQDREGHLWFGTASVGLCRFDGEEISWMYEERLDITPAGGSFGIRSIFQDRQGDFWICNTRNRFAFSSQSRDMDGSKLLQYEKKPGFPKSATDDGENFTYFHAMVEDAAGALWIAAENSAVWKHDAKGVTKYPLVEGAYALNVFIDQRGKVWASTLEHGVFTFDGKAFRPFRLE